MVTEEKAQQPVRQIWKYKLMAADHQKIEMPVGAVILTAQTQGDDVCLWAEVDPDQPVNQIRRIDIFGTGHPIYPANRQYIATVQAYGGGLVFHVYERLAD